MKLRLILLLFLTGHALPLRALEFRLVSLEGDLQGLKYSDDKTQVAIDAAEESLSALYHFESKGPLVLYREVKTEDKTVRVPVATLTVPSGFTQAIILLAYADSTRTTYRGTWINDSFAVRPPQTVTYRNFSSYTVAVKLGAEDHVIPPKEGLTLTTGATTERVVFKAAAQTESGWQLIASTVQPVRPGMRTFVILRDGRPDHHGHTEILDRINFSDYPPPPKPAANSTGNQ